MRNRFISLSKVRWLRPVSLGLASLALSGCFYANTAQVPIATTYPYTEQQRMQAAHHWEVLARHEANGILRSERVRFRDLHVASDVTRDAHNDAHAYLSAYRGGEFGRGIRALLTSELVTRGGNVTATPQPNAATIHIDVEVVSHTDRHFTRPPAGAFTALATGIAVATVPLNRWSEPALGLIPAAMLADTLSGSWTYTGHDEIIVTTQIIDDERILYSSSNIYYINAGDRSHYAPYRAPQAPIIPTVSITDSW